MFHQLYTAQGETLGDTPWDKVTRVIRTCLKALNFGAFRPFFFEKRQLFCRKEEQKSPQISMALRSKILKGADFCPVKA